MKKKEVALMTKQNKKSNKNKEIKKSKINLEC